MNAVSKPWGTTGRRFWGRALSLSLAATVMVGVQVTGAAPAFAADPVDGGVTAAPADSLFPNQGNSGYDVSHYDIKLKADFVTATASAAVGTSTVDTTTTISASTTGAPLKSYSFDFQGSTGNLAASTYNVDTVTVNGAPATFTRIEQSSTSAATADNHKLIITPSVPVDGDFTTVVTAHGAPVIHFDTDGSAEGWNNTTDGATFVNQPVGSMTLFPNNNTPRDKATYTVSSDVPSMLKSSSYANAGGKPYPSAVAGNGELISKTPSADGSRTTWVWDEKKQMASELMIVSIGRYDVYESDINLASGRTLHEWSFIDPAISVSNQNTTQNARAQFKSLFDFYESKFGPYPGNSTGVVTDIVPSTINYALETQDRPFFPNSAGGSFNHEQMHQWWGDNVSPWDWNDITLNEGPATWGPLQFAYEGGGTSTTTTEQSVYNSWNTTSATSSTFTIPSAAMTNGNQLFGQQVYARGSMTLEALRTAIGVTDYETLMRQYQLTYGGGQITGRRTQAFENMAEAISGRDLTAFFQAWWFTPTKPVWPAKYNLSVAGPAGLVGSGSTATYTLAVKNTGKVAIVAGGGAAGPQGVTVTFDAADILDEATVGTLPAGVTQSGTTLTWTVPATALAATSTVDIPFTVSATEANGKLVGTARATTLGSTCVDCTTTNIVGRNAISPAVTAISGGTPTVGQPLTADTSGWAAGTTFTYQWFQDGIPVPGATSATFTPGSTVVGVPVTVEVTGKLAGFNTTSVTSPATAVGVRATQMTGTPPTITGTPKVGGTQLVASPGTWEPGTVYAFQWRANGVNISGATGPRYIPSVATQAGQTLDVVVTGTKAGFTTLSKTSAVTDAVAAPDALASTPTPVLPAAAPKVGVPFAADYGSWDDGTVLTFTWQANGTNISGATSGSFTPTATQQGQALTVTVTGTKPGVPAVVKVSPASAPVALGTQTLQPTPTITGTPRVGTASTGVQGTWDTGTTKTNKWYADGVEIAGATGTTYTPTADQVGKVLTYEVTSTRAGYTTVTKTSAGKTILGLAQTLQPTPTVTGTAQVGSTLTGVPGTWDDGTTLAYQWLADGTAVDGATGLTYDVRAADLGKVITFKVTSTKDGSETVSKTSDPTTAVVAGDLTATPVPTITGTPKVGVELTAVPGDWDAGTTFAYQWVADGTDVDGATSATYTPGPGKVGAVITVKVTGSKTGYTPVTRTSDPTAPVANGDLVGAPVPTITGDPKVGVELTAVPGDWATGTTFTYQWTADGENVDGATAATYTPGPGTVGKVIRVNVTGTSPGYDPVTKISQPTAPVAAGDLGATPVPTITGTPKVAVTLTAVPGDWDAGTTFAYQWSADGTPVDGATSATYTPGADTLGKVITVAVTGSRTGYTSITKSSAPTAPVAAGDLVLTPTPTITGGPAKVAVPLTAVPGTWDNGTTLTYQWFAGATAITGATGATYTPVADDLGKVITVKVTGTKTGYTPVTKTSAGTAAVAAGDLVLAPTPTISGTPKVEQTLTGDAGLWDSGTALSYQWFRGSVAINGATGLTYVLRAGDAGALITFKVTGTKTGYATVTRSSAPTTAVAKGDQTLAPTPTITGVPAIGSELTAHPGTWDADTTLAIQWFVDGLAVDGATGDTYTPVLADLGKPVTVSVTSTKTGYNALTTTSAPTANVAPAAFTMVGTPTVTGDPKVGATLTAHEGTWDEGVAFTYQWVADGADIEGATDSTYVLKVADLGKEVRVLVTGTKTGFATQTVISGAALATLPGDLTATPTPTIAGTATFGQKLTATAGTWDDGVDLTYAWYAGGAPIVGATSSTLVIPLSAVGHTVTVKVTGTKTGYSTVVKGSKSTPIVAKATFASKPKPTIAGTATVGRTLTAKPGTWASGTTLTYQWFAGGKAISGAKAKSFTLKAGQKGKRIQVQVTATKAGYVTVVQKSVATAQVK